MAMRNSNIRMTTRVEKARLLETLRTNLGRHKQIVQEARDGYVKKAREALEERLEQLRTGKLVSLTFHLSPPADYSEVYQNSIAMLEWNTDETVELEADEFRQLVRDEWDWMGSFLSGNSGYSATAARLAAGGVSGLSGNVSQQRQL
jgi:hypothetical protein